MADKAQQPAILRFERITPRDRGGGARTVQLVTRKIGATGFINGITEFEPNAGIPLHSHNCEESVVVLEGRAIVEIEGVRHHVGPGDATFLPPNVEHRFINASPTERMRILWTYASVDATRTMIGSGQTQRIEAEHGD